MNFIPTKQMKYAAALKNITAKSIYRNGFTQRNRENLKKIIFFEAVFCNSSCKQTVNLRELTDSLFGAAVIFCAAAGVRLKTTLSSHMTGRVNVRLYEILLALIISSFCKGERAALSFSVQRGGIKLCILSANPPKIDSSLLNALGATQMKINNPQKIAFFIPVEASDEPPQNTPGEFDYLADPFSAMRLFATENVSRF